MKSTGSYAFISGDRRQIYLMKLLLDAGNLCTCYGLPVTTDNNLNNTTSIKAALDGARYILCPIPFGKLTPSEIDELLVLVTKDQIVFGGCLPDHFTRELDRRKIVYHDYMKAEELTLFNTIATAEGAVAEAVISYPGNLHKSSCLVIGWGRCSKTLAARLKALGADTTICSRQRTSLAEADSFGYHGVLLSNLKEQIFNYQLIFNTAPEVVLTEPVLTKVNKDTYIIDIASAPGGADLDAVKKYQLNYRLYPGLPGKYAPRASAEALYRFIEQTII